MMMMMIPWMTSWKMSWMNVVGSCFVVVAVVVQEVPLEMTMQNQFLPPLGLAVVVVVVAFSGYCGCDYCGYCSWWTRMKTYLVVGDDGLCCDYYRHRHQCRPCHRNQWKLDSCCYDYYYYYYCHCCMRKNFSSFDDCHCCHCGRNEKRNFSVVVVVVA